MKHFFLNTAVGFSLLLGLSGCLSTPASGPGSADFTLNAVTVAPMTKANLCTRLDGAGKQPEVTISHSPVAGVPIVIRMFDKLSNGGTYDHKSVRVLSDGSGTTRVNDGFLPPCNTNAGRVDSSYRFTVEAAGQSVTRTWADFLSGPLRILQP